MESGTLTRARTNLRQAGEIEKSSQWAKARLIAASTEKGRPGRPAKNLPTGRQINSKVSVSTASLDTGMHRDTITAYLNAWNAAAADGLCAPSTDLTPADGWTAMTQGVEPANDTGVTLDVGVKSNPSTTCSGSR